MDNNPEISGKYLGTITEDFVFVSDTLKEASYAVRKRGFSDFPIFPICKVEQPIGKLLIGVQELNLKWNYHITYLDEFVQREIIAAEKMEDFKASYKDPDEFCCLFVIDNNFTNFVFIPYPED
jgi:hypothetical protein